MNKRRLVEIGLLAACVAGFVLLLPPIGRAGVGEGEELRVAEAARHHAAGPASAVTLASIAAGFRLFGVHTWAGRLPMALWTIAGIAAVGLAVARLVDRRAGAYAALAMAATPLVFVQARTMGDAAVAGGAVAIAFGAACLALFDVRAGARWRATAAVVAAAATAASGAAAGWLMAAAALGGAAIAWWTVARSRDRLGGGLAVACSLGAAALIVAFAPRAPTAANVGFDVVLGRAAHALAPWSAFAPFAFARLFARPAARLPPEERGVRAAVVVAASLVMAAHALLAAAGHEPPVVLAPFVAAACAVALRDLDRGAHAPAIVAVGTALVALVLLRDLRALPPKLFEPFAVAPVTLPDAARATAIAAWTAALGLFVAGALATWWPTSGVDDSDPPAALRPARYVARARAALEALGAPAVRAYAAVTAASAVGAFFVAVSERAARRLSTPAKDALFAAPVLLVALPLFAFVVAPLASDVAAWATRRLFRGARGAPLVVAGLLGGAVLALVEYPAIAEPLSPQLGFDAFARTRAPGDELALLGVPDRALAAGAYAGAPPSAPALPDARAAIEWLARAGEARRFLLVSRDRLLELDTLSRERSHASLPVLDARASDVVLAVSSLRPGEASKNPFAPFFLRAPPAPTHPLDAELGGQLHVAGYDVLEASGAPAHEIAPGRTYRMRVYVGVDERPTTAWQIFVHVDGQGRRQNVDHPPLGGKVPPTSWVPGDLVVDEFDLSFPPNFTPGRYRLYFGFYVGETRLEVKRGPSDGANRIDGGELLVR